MNINLLNDLNVYISYSENHSNTDFSIIKKYPNIDWKFVGDNSECYFKINLLDNYLLDNLKMNFSQYSGTVDLLVSDDNLNWNKIASDIKVNSFIDFEFNESYYCAFIKFEFKNVDNLYLDTIDIEYSDNSSINDYNNYFAKYKKMEMNDFLPNKLFANTDIKTIFKKYLEL